MWVCGSTKPGIMQRPPQSTSSRSRPLARGQHIPFVAHGLDEPAGREERAVVEALHRCLPRARERAAGVTRREDAGVPEKHPSHAPTARPGRASSSRAWSSKPARGPARCRSPRAAASELRGQECLGGDHAVDLRLHDARAPAAGLFPHALQHCEQGGLFGVGDVDADLVSPLAARSTATAFTCGIPPLEARMPAGDALRHAHVAGVEVHVEGHQERARANRGRPGSWGAAAARPRRAAVRDCRSVRAGPRTVPFARPRGPAAQAAGAASS